MVAPNRIAAAGNHLPMWQDDGRTNLALTADSVNVDAYVGISMWADLAVGFRGDHPFRETLTPLVGVDFMRLHDRRWLFGVAAEYLHVRYLRQLDAGAYAHRAALKFSVARVFESNGLFHGPKLAVGPYLTVVRYPEGHAYDQTSLMVDVGYVVHTAGGLTFGVFLQGGFGQGNGAAPLAGGLEATVGYGW